MVWMTILTGSSGLPANETRRGRQVGQGGGGGGVNGCHSLLFLLQRLVADWQKSPHVKVGG